MSTHTAIVGSILRIDPPVGTTPIHLLMTSTAPVTLQVRFNDAQNSVAFLDTDHPQFAAYKEVLSELQGMEPPLYAQVDAQMKITKLVVPVQGKVAVLSRNSLGEVTFRLDNSARPFVLQMANEQHREWVKVLQAAQFDGAPVLVVEDERETEIVDIRRVENPPSPALLKVAGFALASHPAAARRVTRKEATELFDIVAKRSCDPLAPSGTCIPFLYPRDGCHARAHEMCRLMIEAGAQPGKVWNFSNRLVVKTPNEPNCKATWGIHVAPTLQVQSPGDAEAETQVIDPSLFDGPVPVATWQNEQGDPDSVLAYTSFHPFLPPMAGDVDTDPMYEETRQALILYRSKLRLRAHKTGCPPYQHCQA